MNALFAKEVKRFQELPKTNLCYRHWESNSISVGDALQWQFRQALLLRLNRAFLFSRRE